MGSEMCIRDRIEISEDDRGGHVWLSDTDCDDRRFLYRGTRPLYLGTGGGYRDDMSECVFCGGS